MIQLPFFGSIIQVPFDATTISLAGLIFGFVLKIDRQVTRIETKLNDHLKEGK